MMFQKKRFFETKKIKVGFSIGDFPAKPAKQQNKKLLKIIEVTHSRRSGRGRGTGVLIFWNTIFFSSKFLIWPTGLPWRRSSSKVTARWRYRLPSNNLTARYNSQFFCKLSFWFWPGSPKMALNVSELGLNIIQFNSNLYVGVFPCMLEKDCNGKPISTFPPCYAFQMNWPLGRFSL